MGQLANQCIYTRPLFSSELGWLPTLLIFLCHITGELRGFYNICTSLFLRHIVIGRPQRSSPTSMRVETVLLLALLSDWSSAAPKETREEWVHKSTRQCTLDPAEYECPSVHQRFTGAGVFSCKCQVRMLMVNVSSVAGCVWSLTRSICNVASGHVYCSLPC